MKINIVIPFYQSKDTIDALLNSIDDQDYDNFDVTIVFDGPDPRARKQVEETYFNANGQCKTRYNLYLEDLPFNQGASAARNFGAKISGENLMAKNPGEILFFIDADCQLYPGILNEIVTQFEDNPDIDFVYGNYRFEHKENYISLPFDAYRLETMNYISTMSPVRRSAFNRVGGFQDADYFQDWSLFYRLAKAGSKGKYINEFFFSTEKPTEKSISGTQGLTLSEKSANFRKVHGIKDKTLVVTSWGADYQALQRAKILDADFVSHTMGEHKVIPPNYAFDNWKGTYMVGCYNQTPEALGRHMGSMVGVPIYHFIGTDVFQMMNCHNVATLRDFRAKFREQGAKIFVNSPRCLEEMQACGFDEAKLLYTPIYDFDRWKYLRDTPADFTVAVYHSESPMMHLDGAGGYSNIRDWASTRS